MICANFGLKLVQQKLIILNLTNLKIKLRSCTDSFNDKKINFVLEMSLCMWRNTFNCDVVGKMALHISSLTKWDKTTLTFRKRVFPSGRPKEKKYSMRISDPTWKKEYNYFLSLIKKRKTDLSTDLFINSILKKLK